MKAGKLCALIYAAALPGLQQIAHDLGYALAVHGSMQRDFDLVAVPWTDAALPAEALIEAIAGELMFWKGGPPVGPEAKPHGRRAWCIPLATGMYLDVSVMPREESL